MDAKKGDRLIIEGTKLGQARRSGEVLHVDGAPEHRRLWVRWDDGHESLVMPGAGATIERRATAPRRK
jgi:hypothetical protein